MASVKIDAYLDILACFPSQRSLMLDLASAPSLAPSRFKAPLLSRSLIVLLNCIWHARAFTDELQVPDPVSGTGLAVIKVFSERADQFPVQPRL